MTVLHRPRTLDEACALLADLGDAQVYGGGTAIQILRKQGVLFTDHLIDIGLVPGLDQVTDTGDGVRVGAMVSVRQMETDARVQAAAPLASNTYRRVANARIRNTARVGGNLAHGDYRLDPPTALLALDARVEMASVRGRRQVPVREFFTDFQQTALQPDEVLVSITIPHQPAGATGRYVKLSSLGANDWPCASAAALLVDDGARRWLRLGLAAVAPTPVFCELEVTGRDRPAAVADATEVCESLLDPIPDIRGSREYKRHLALVAVQEAVEAAWKEHADA